MINVTEDKTLEVKQFLKNYFGYDQFRPFQEEIINNVLKGEDAFVLMPTGGGKSLCYQLPALKFDGLTVVVSPLISLMKDQVDALKANGVNASYINSSLSYQEISRGLQRVRAGNVKILYVAPERLALDTFQKFLQTLQISLIAIDEAHCISEWGHDFRPEYGNLKFLKRQFQNVPMIALTATATPKVQEDIVKQLSLDNPRVFISSLNRENLTFRVVRKKKAFGKLIRLLEKHKEESAIIYCFSRKETEEIVCKVKKYGFDALPYHAGLDNALRKQHQERFIKDDVRIMVATIAFGMGIDKPDIRLIVHYTFPRTLEGYYQEIGRAGRDSLKSECVLFYSYGDTIKHEFFLKQIEDTDYQEKARKKLKQIIRYCEHTTCRRHYILRYFGEEYSRENCGACDICLGSQAPFDATDVARKICACISHTGGRFGKNYIIGVLKGKETPQILNNHHTALPVFGSIQDFTHEEIKYVIKALLDRNLLETTEGKYPTLSITQRGMEWIEQEQILDLPRMQCFDVDDAPKKGEQNGQKGYDVDLFEKLRVLRKEIANQQGVPPFVIFGDVSLREMAHYFPADAGNFSRIRGVGTKKLEDFGEAFLAVIRRHCKEHNLSSREVPAYTQGRNGKAQREVQKGDSRYEKTKQMLCKKLSLSEMARQHGFTEGTIINHIEKLTEAGERLDIDYLEPPRQSFEKIQKALATCGDERLKPVYEYLNGEHSYNEIRLVRLFCKIKPGLKDSG